MNRIIKQAIVLGLFTLSLYLFVSTGDIHDNVYQKFREYSGPTVSTVESLEHQSQWMNIPVSRELVVSVYNFRVSQGSHLSVSLTRPLTCQYHQDKVVVTGLNSSVEICLSMDGYPSRVCYSNAHNKIIYPLQGENIIISPASNGIVRLSVFPATGCLSTMTLVPYLKAFTWIVFIGFNVILLAAVMGGYVLA